MAYHIHHSEITTITRILGTLGQNLDEVATDLSEIGKRVALLSETFAHMSEQVACLVAELDGGENDDV